jgi:hypothetical protein
MFVFAACSKGARHTALLTTVYTGHTSVAADQSLRNCCFPIILVSQIHQIWRYFLGFFINFYENTVFSGLKHGKKRKYGNPLRVFCLISNAVSRRFF